MLVDIKPDPEEEDFFEGSWLHAEGFQGLRIHRPALAKAITQLEEAVR